MGRIKEGGDILRINTFNHLKGVSLAQSARCMAWLELERKKKSLEQQDKERLGV